MHYIVMHTRYSIVQKFSNKLLWFLGLVDLKYHTTSDRKAVWGSASYQPPMHLIKQYHETDNFIGDIPLISGSWSAGSVYGDDNIEEFEKIDNILELDDEKRRTVDIETTSEYQVENLENRIQKSTNFELQSALASVAKHTNQETNK